MENHENDINAQIAERLSDAQDMLARGNENHENGLTPVTGYLIGALAELIEIAKAQQAIIERLTADRH